MGKHSCYLFAVVVIFIALGLTALWRISGIGHFIVW